MSWYGKFYYPILTLSHKEIIILQEDYSVYVLHLLQKVSAFHLLTLEMS
jgi:hypothetical protein